MNKITSKIRDFLNSNYYIVTVFLFTVLAWYLRIQIVAMSIYALLLFLIIIIDAKRINIITLIMATVINYRVATMEDNLPVMVTFALILAPVIIYDIVRKKPKFNNKILISMILIFIVNILSLVNTTKDTIIFGIVGVGQSALYMIIFLYFFNNKNKDDYRKIAINAMAMGIAIFLELVILLLTFEGEVINKSTVTLGWGLSNFIAITVTVLIPITFYLYIENQKRKFVLVAVILEIITIFLTFSKGAFLALGIILIPFIIVAFYFAKSKKTLLIDGAICIAIFLIGIFLLSGIDAVWKGFLSYFDKMSDRGWFKDEARLKIYKIGIDQFLRHPILGSGAYTGQYYLKTNINYHNYFIQTIATLGSLGLITFLYYMFCTIKQCLVKNYFNICILFIIIAMSIHGLVDTTWYNPLIMVIISFCLPNLFEKQRTEIDLE